MQKGNQQQHFRVVVVLDSGKTKVVNVKAATQETAERRALKRTPNGVDIQRS